MHLILARSQLNLNLRDSPCKIILRRIKLCPAAMAKAVCLVRSIIAGSVPVQCTRHLPDDSLNKEQLAFEELLCFTHIPLAPDRSPWSNKQFGCSALFGRGHEDGCDDAFDLFTLAFGASNSLLLVFLQRQEQSEFVSALSAFVLVSWHMLAEL